MTHRLLAYVFLASFQTSAIALTGFTVSREELARMPAYCTASYGALVGLPQMQESLRGTIPPDCPSIHHYCDGLKAMIRVDSIPTEKDAWLSSAISSFQGVVRDWEHRGQTCSVRPEAYTNLGKGLRRRNRASTAEAIAYFHKALELKPDYLPAYFALSDSYLDIGKKSEALGVVEEGLKYVPDSKGLLRRFKELGGITPPAPIAKPNPQQPSAAAGPGPEPSTSPSTTPNRTGGESVVGAPAAVEPEPPKIGSPTDPYCRFCPN
ncbi:MAG: tetratricopeptide repeat protein [Thiobacillaceae bacterium]